MARSNDVDSWFGRLYTALYGDSWLRQVFVIDSCVCVFPIVKQRLSVLAAGISLSFSLFSVHLLLYTALAGVWFESSTRLCRAPGTCAATEWQKQTVSLCVYIISLYVAIRPTGAVHWENHHAPHTYKRHILQIAGNQFIHIYILYICV